MSERIVCAECGQTFILSYDEQRWYREQGWQIPKRCDVCRARRRQERDSGNVGFSGPPPQLDSQSSPQAPRKSRRPSAFAPKVSGPSSPSRPPQRRARSWWGKPALRYGVISFGLTFILTLLIVSFDSPLDFVAGWLFAITLVTFWTFGYDKAIAEGSWLRVPEKVLFALVFFGGTLGALLARPFFHHKTIKLSFRLKFWAIVIAQLGLIAIYYRWVKPWLGL